jgi:spoIIIJ-associated protein
MEWVETTGRTVAAALDAALDTLGVDEDEVEYEVLEEPRGGLLGRREARIRARVRPISREKPNERRRRAGRARGATGGRGGNRRGDGRRGDGRRGDARSGERGRRQPASDRGVAVAEPGEGRAEGRGDGRTRRRRGGGGRASGANAETREEPVSEVPVEDQAREAETFTRGLVEAFGAPATVETIIDDDGGVLVDVRGEDLGLLVGPRGVTLQAIEELVRTVVQRTTEGRGARINVDVAGYRARRREALARFATELADKVRDTGRDQALEPMSASDRKVVHDTIAALDGVTTVSEGEEPRRRVVVRPA